MPSELPPSKSAGRLRAYRARQLAAGCRELTLLLPNETIAFLDEIKERQGLRSRSQVLVTLIEQGRRAAQ